MYTVNGFQCNITTHATMSDLHKTIITAFLRNYSTGLDLTLYKEDMLTAVVTGKVV